MNPDSPEARATRYIRQLIWLYFWLLLVEGALRKWLLPDLSNPLLVIRDPVVLAIYGLSFRARVFPKNLGKDGEDARGLKLNYSGLPKQMKLSLGNK